MRRCPFIRPRWGRLGVRLCCGVLLVLVAAALPLWAQPAPQTATQRASDVSPAMTASRITGAIVVDGKLTDEAWSQLTPWSAFSQQSPDEGAAPTERTDVRIGYDDDALYVGVRAYDARPDLVERRLSRRDGSAVTDWIAIYLDPRFDHLTGAAFMVSAAGVQSDANIDNDFHVDFTWDAVWASAVTVDEQGWVAEVRIPFSQLRFSRGQTPTWGFNIRRYIFRKNEDLWLRMSPRADNRRLASRFAQLSGMDAVRSSSHLELLPHYVTRLESVSSDPADPFASGRGFGNSVGADIKWGPTSALTVDATVNPDFGQVELDPSVINLTEFETSFNEKRQFFVEGAPIFANFGQIGSGVAASAPSLFYSRRIGRPPQGRVKGSFVDTPAATTILEAAKITGKVANGWSLGVLEALTSNETARSFTTAGGLTSQSVEPFTSYVIARALRETSRGGDGVMTTLVGRRLGGSPLQDTLVGHALTFGYDGYRFLGAQRAWVASGMFAMSNIGGSTSAILGQQESSRRYFQRPDVHYVSVDPLATSLSGWNLGGTLQKRTGNLRPHVSAYAVNPRFEANDAGFQKRADERGFGVGLDWYNYVAGPRLRSRSINVTQQTSWNFGGQNLLDRWAGSVSLEFPSYRYLSAGYTLNLDTSDDHLTRGGPVGRAPRAHSLYVSYGGDSRRKLWYGGGGGAGWNASGGWDWNAYLSLRADPTTRVRVTTSPYFFRARSSAQYFTQVEDALAAQTYGSRYIFANLGQTQFTFTTRVDMSLSPTMSLQVYAEPFIGTGHYNDFKEFRRPNTFSFLRYGIDTGTLGPRLEDGSRDVDPDGSGPAPAFSLYDGDYDAKSLQTKAVFRWEFKPGSTIYGAWTQVRDAGSRADDVFMVKLSWWLSPQLPVKTSRR